MLSIGVFPGNFQQNVNCWLMFTAFCPKTVCLETKNPAEKNQSNHPNIGQISICQKTDKCFLLKQNNLNLACRKKTFEGSLGLWKSMSPSYLKNHLQRWTLTWFGPSSTQVPRMYIYIYMLYCTHISIYMCIERERERLRDYIPFTILPQNIPK